MKLSRRLRHPIMRRMIYVRGTLLQRGYEHLSSEDISRISESVYRVRPWSLEKKAPNWPARTCLMSFIAVKGEYVSENPLATWLSCSENRTCNLLVWV